MRFDKNGLHGSYDPKFDILYIYYKGRSYSYGKELSDGFVVFKEIEGDKLSGYLIYDFKDKMSKGLIDISKFDLVFKVTIQELINEI